MMGAGRWGRNRVRQKQEGTKPGFTPGPRLGNNNTVEVGHSELGREATSREELRHGLGEDGRDGSALAAGD